MVIDQLRIGNKYSYDDFEANVRERKIGSPKKKTIKDTVPFSNVTHDFSKINGELYWEERTLEYILEIDADTPEELETKKLEFATWLMNVINEELHDPFIEDYHFLATFADIDFDDSEVEKTTVTVTFTAYPYMIANTKKTFEVKTSTKEEHIRIENKSSHRITPILTASIPVSFEYGNMTFSVSGGEITDEAFKLEIGVNEITVLPTAETGTLRIEFVEEVF